MSGTLAGAMTREEWLHSAATLMASGLFAPAGYTVPRLHVSIGFPFRARGQGNNAIGQCWADRMSSDGLCHLFVSPALPDTARVCDVLAHEIVHATVGVAAGHKAEFAKCAGAIGLVKPWTATTASDAFKAFVAERIVTLIGAYPHPVFGQGLHGPDGTPAPGPQPSPPGEPGTGPTGAPKQGTRLLKATCSSCGYTIRVTKKWADLGLPRCSCPDHKRFALA